MENEEIIRQKMEHTRESLTDKLEILENKLLSSVEQATSAVNETVASVKETVNESVESVKEAIDIPAHVDRHPWVSLGGAVLCAFVLGNLFRREREPPRRRIPPLPPVPPNGNGRQEPVQQPPQARGSWMNVVEPEIHHLKRLALGAALGTVREMLTAEVPPHMAGQLREIIDAATKKLGGDPIPSSDWDAIKRANPSSGTARQGGDLDAGPPCW